MSLGDEKLTDPRRTSHYPGGATGPTGRARSAAGARPTPRPIGPELQAALRSSGYEVLGELGRGGTGIVYLARNIALDRMCALKTFPGGGADATASARFRAEAEAVARLQHPHVVQIHAVGEAAGLPYLELEHMVGGTLADALDGTPWPAHTAAGMIEPVARAVAETHRLGIIHRDLKPANILLDADGVPKVGDFGLAKSLASDVRLTRTGQVVGTPCYMAPEQAGAGGEEVGPAADVYSLGTILYELLVGRPPFLAPSVLQTLDMVRSREPIGPRRMQPALPRDLETICLKCLEKDPWRRYAGAEELAEDLGRFLRDRPVQARPTCGAERACKWARRRPAVAALSAALLATAALALVLVAWQWRRAEGKAASESLARRDAARGQAQLAMDQGRALCEQGEIGQGLIWLGRSLRMTEQAGDEALGRAARINLAEWSARLGRPLARLQALAPVLDLAFEADGRALVALGEDGAVRRWEAEGWRQVGRPILLEGLDLGAWPAGPGEAHPPRGEATAVFGRAWCGQHRHGVRRRHRAASALATPEPPTRSELWRAAFEEGGRRLVAGVGDGLLRRWDVASGLPVGEPARRGAEDAAFAVSPDGLTLASGGDDGRVTLREAASGRALGPGMDLDSPVRRVAFAGDGRRILALSRDGRVRVWDSGSARVSDLTPEDAEVASLAVSADGATFATGTEGGTVRLRDSATLRPIGRTFKLVEAARSLAFRPDGRALAVGQGDGTIRVWEVPRTGPIAPSLLVEGPVRAVAFSRDGSRLLAVGGRRPSWRDLGRSAGPAQARPSRLERPGDAAPAPAPGGRPGRSAPSAISPDVRWVASTDEGGPGMLGEGRVVLLDAESGAFVRALPGGPHPVAGLVFSPDSARLLTWGPKAGTAMLRPIDGTTPGRPLFRSLGVAIQGAAFSADGGTLVLGCRDGKARLWDVARDAEIQAESRPHHAYAITVVAFDPRSSRVVTGCHSGTVRFWDRSSGGLLADVRGNAGEVSAVAFSPDGRILLTGSLDATARFWDVESGRQLGPPLHHSASVLSVAFSPDGRSVATGTRDGVWLWRVPAAPMEGDLARIDRVVGEQTRLTFDVRLMIPDWWNAVA